MKTAVAFYGQSRGSEETWNSILNAIGSPDTVDYFIHTWSYHKSDLYVDRESEFNRNPVDEHYFSATITTQNASNEKVHSILQKFKPKKIQIDEQICFNNEKYFYNKSPETVSLTYAVNYQRIKSQAYSRKKSIDLIEQHQTETGTQYNKIFQIRTDVVILSCPPTNNLKCLHIDGSVDYVFDSVFYGSFPVMRQFSKFYDHADELWCFDALPADHNEKYLGTWIQSQQIPTCSFKLHTNSEYGLRGIKR